MGEQFNPSEGQEPEVATKHETRSFLKEGSSLSEIARGGSVIVYEIHNDSPDFNAEGKGDEDKKIVLKEYLQSQENIDFLFGQGQKPSVEEQGKILERRQRFAQKYYDGLPDLILQSQFSVAENSEGKPTVYEMQPKIEDYKPATLSNVENITGGLSKEQRINLSNELAYFIKRTKDIIDSRNFPEGYDDFLSHIPDFQDGNLVVTSDGKLRMIDTNKYIDINSQKNTQGLFLSDIECFRIMLRKIKKSIKK